MARTTHPAENNGQNHNGTGVMPYYIYTVTVKDQATVKKAAMVNEFENFKTAKTEIRQLRTEKPLGEGQSYKIIFADNPAEAEKKVTEVREEPIAREWEK